MATVQVSISKSTATSSSPSSVPLTEVKRLASPVAGCSFSFRIAPRVEYPPVPCHTCTADATSHVAPSSFEGVTD